MSNASAAKKITKFHKKSRSYIYLALAASALWVPAALLTFISPVLAVLLVIALAAFITFAINRSMSHHETFTRLTEPVSVVI